MKNFDTYIGIDWSGARTPKRTRAIAVALCRRDQTVPFLLGGKPYWSREDIGLWIPSLLGLNARVLIGIDANFGYCQDIGQAQFGADYDYKTLWAAVEEAARDEPNFFAGPYWEAYPQYFWTAGKRPAHITLPKRLVEQACGEAGYGWPESPFKLLGPKQVGKGGLAAMRMAYHLKREMGDRICIWPFEREIADSAQIVMSEIYPRQFLMRAGHGVAKVRNFSELNTALEKLQSEPMTKDYDFSDHDADAIVSAVGLRMLCGDGETIPNAIANPPRLDDIRAKREGWIFGV